MLVSSSFYKNENIIINYYVLFTMAELIFDSDISDDEKEQNELTFSTIEQHEHMLHRPGMYIGSTSKIESTEPVWVVKNKRFVEISPVYKYDKTLKSSVKITPGVTYSAGLLRIFIEVVSNALDNVWRSKQFGINCKSIKIFIDKNTGKTTVWNDGKPIPFKDDNQIYIPERIFSHFRTSSNYNDDEERKTSGTYGLGGKVSNVFSKEFSIRCFNPSEQKIYTQKWENNMYKRHDPVLINCKKVDDLPKNSGFTEVTWIPDFKRFGMENYDDDILSLYEKYIYDTAMDVSKYNVRVYFNDEVIPVY